MSEKSFAVGSVAAAVIWGTFFYPPPPPERALQGIKAVHAPVAAARVARNDARLAHAAPRPAGAPERRWWRRNLLELATSRTHP